MNKFKIYFDCIRKLKKAIGASLLYDLLEGVILIRSASFLGQFANAIFSMEVTYAIKNIYYLLLCIVCYVLILPAFNFLLDYICIKDGTKYILFINSLFFEKEYDKAKELSVGEVRYRLEGDVISFYCFIIVTVSKAVATPLIFTYLLYHAVNISYLYTFITLVITLINFIVPIYIRNIQAKYDRQIREYNEKVNAYVTEITTRPHIIRVLNLSGAFSEKLDTLFWKYFKKTKDNDINYRTVADNISSLLKTLSTLSIVLVGAMMVAKGSISAGSILAMIGYLALFETIINNCSYIIQTVPKLKNLADRLMFFYVDYEKMEGESTKSEVSIIASSLSFSYSQEEKIINYLDFTILPGTKTVICGTNGSGKTTLMDIISGLHKNYMGSIKVNETELNQASITWWREEIAIARQNPYMFEGKVEENIRLGNLNATKDEVERLMKELDILYLKGKPISLDACELSGGEKQKVSIARALLKESPILLLDEPNNNLDEEGITWLKHFITNSEKTIIYISHLDELTQCADQVIQLRS